MGLKGVLKKRCNYMHDDVMILFLFIFRYLSDLHAPGDPAWQCIIAQHKWILQLMQNCKEDFIKEQKGTDTDSLK